MHPCPTVSCEAAALSAAGTYARPIRFIMGKDCWTNAVLGLHEGNDASKDIPPLSARPIPAIPAN